MPKRRAAKRTTKKRATGKKWGKIGAPNSATRKAHLAKIRKKR